MTRARRLAWIAGAAVVAAAVTAAVLALPGVEPPPARPAGAGSPVGAAAAGSDAAAAPVSPGAPGDGDVAQAARLVASARAERAAGHLLEARTLLARAHALDPQPATLLELAAVELQTGRCREARRAAQRVIADGDGALAAQASALMGQIGRCD